MDGMVLVPNASTTVRDDGRRWTTVGDWGADIVARVDGMSSSSSCGGDSGADIVARVDGRRDDRAATIDVVVVVIEDVDERDGAGAECGDGDDGAR